MTIADYLLLAIVVLLAYSIYQSAARHAEIKSLLNDQSTMLGDLLGAILKELRK